MRLRGWTAVDTRGGLGGGAYGGQAGGDLGRFEGVFLVRNGDRPDI